MTTDHDDLSHRLRRDWLDLAKDAHQLSPENLNRHLSGLLNDAAEIEQSVLSTTAEAWGARRVVQIRVNAMGVVEEARVTGAVTRLSPDEIAEEIISASRGAAEKVRASVTDALSPLLHFSSEMESVIAPNGSLDFLNDERIRLTEEINQLYRPQCSDNSQEYGLTTDEPDSAEQLDPDTIAFLRRISR